MKMLLSLSLLLSLLAPDLRAGEFEDRVHAAQEREQAALKAKAEARRAQAIAVFGNLVTSVVNRRFGGFRDGLPQISGHAHDGGALYMGEWLGTTEFTTRTNLVCHAWGNAMCRNFDGKCSFGGTKVACADPEGKVTDSGWLDRAF